MKFFRFFPFKRIFSCGAILLLLATCDQGNLGSNPLSPNGTALDEVGGGGIAPGSDGVGGSPGGISSEMGPGGGINAAVPTLDEGVVGPETAYLQNPPALFGDASIQCRMAEGLVKMKLKGRVMHINESSTTEPSQYVDFEPSDGMTLRIVDKVRKLYMDVPVEPVPEDFVQNENGPEQKNQFYTSLTTLYPFPQLDHDENNLKFYISQANDQDSIYNQMLDCPESNICAVQAPSAQATSQENLVQKKPMDTFCHDPSWPRVWALPIFLKAELDPDAAPFCNIFKKVENPKLINQD